MKLKLIWAQLEKLILMRGLNTAHKPISWSEAERLMLENESNHF